ncbi:MAG: SagB/ThcOx family dehydrogenase [Sideroxydans sp.]|nr:SagB/ThcOx family dehydrogenase [Sideroxydans sp.]
MSVEAQQTVRAYHQRTKHRFEAYAPGPETLDWDAQPIPFRHFEAAENVPLPALQAIAQQPAFAAMLRRPLHELAQPVAAQPPSLAALGMLLQLSLGITAWKSYGPDRWAVRANPSSGNLHPVEAYLFLRGVPDIADGLYHYRPDSHALECRATFTPSPGPAQLFVGLSSVMWRETWKYGERAFRYCQLDTGHAVGALRYAAALLGWPLTEQRTVGTAMLAQSLGLDRSADFASGRRADTEREEAEILLSLSSEPDLEWLHRASTTARWHGKASLIDGHPMYRWPIVEEVAAASQHLSEAAKPVAQITDIPPAITGVPDIAAATLILQRRSAQRFDARHVMPKPDFFAMLDATLPRRQLPWDALAVPPHIALVLFVHRIQDMQPGIYLLPRSPHLAELLNARLDARFPQRQAVADAPPHLGLQLLTAATPAELHRVARSLNCHQDIASNSCFALGMLAEYDPASYRDLFREAGLIGQVLYLHAEAHGLRGTGIGCYFDDPFHHLLGLPDDRLQSIYHFTVGLPLEDTRIETTITDDIRLPA